ncbi:BRO-N domain-containing protein [Desulfovibrio oxyclinae]|uniref:BRO-N domain-containing protein n=1 Tax=Desulfovibrio oxyclinae TaxID=63560 RepID=UPI000377CC66|nr:BRO family protein [Desulfovibrio oxyclinae]
MGSVIPFDFDGSAVRVVMREDEPWFISRDVCNVLGLDRTATRRLEEDEKGVQEAHTLGGVQQVSVLSESGLYALIFTSRKPEARRFRKWVTSEVLPAIRKHGRYESCGTTGLPGDVPDFSLRLKPALRAQAMHTAVQTARLDGGSEQDVKRLYAEFCGLFAARPQKTGAALSDPAADLVRDFVKENLEVTDVSEGSMPRHLKTQAKDLYELFRNWCRDVRNLERSEIPTQNAFGLVLKRQPGVVKVSPINRTFYNLVKICTW